MSEAPALPDCAGYELVHFLGMQGLPKGSHFHCIQNEGGLQGLGGSAGLPQFSGPLAFQEAWGLSGCLAAAESRPWAPPWSHLRLMALAGLFPECLTRRVRTEVCR